jgi:dTDP-4-amino-4,6-dideoxygalactose transaminase
MLWERENMISVPLLDLKAQYQTIRHEIQPVVENIFESQWFIMGPEVEGLEQEIADYSQCKHGIGVSSGTDALLIALMALDIQPGDEIITTPYTFFATAGVIHRLQAKPVFVDIESSTYNINPNLIEPAITPKTKAIIPVHLYGQCADMDAILSIAQKHNLFVIEDAAQAIGSEYHNQRAGSMGTMGCFSFFPSKNLGGFGDGGMVVTNDETLAQKIKKLRNHGMDPKYFHAVVGGNFRLDALQAAVLRIKLKHLDQWSDARQQNAAIYNDLFQAKGLINNPITLPAVKQNRHIYNQFVIRVIKRNELKAFLQEKNIGTEIYYPVALHQQDCFSDLGYKAGDLPMSEDATNTTLALPIYPELSSEQIEYVVDCIGEFYQ